MFNKYIYTSYIYCVYLASLKVFTLPSTSYLLWLFLYAVRVTTSSVPGTCSPIHGTVPRTDPRTHSIQEQQQQQNEGTGRHEKKTKRKETCQLLLYLQVSCVHIIEHGGLKKSIHWSGFSSRSISPLKENHGAWVKVAHLLRDPRLQQ